MPGVIKRPVFNRGCPVAVFVNGTGETRSRTLSKRFELSLFIFSLFAFFAAAPLCRAEAISDANPLAMPAIGDHGLRVLSPSVLELTLINTKVSHAAHVTDWDFVNEQGVATLPAA